MHYLIYKTTNLVNGKTYIGCHKTETVDDDYIGSGKILGRAIAKYGREYFIREILHDYSSAEEMFGMEASLVNEEFIKDKSNYNIKLGGNGGFDYINRTKSPEDRVAHAKLGYAANKEIMSSREVSVRGGERSRDLKAGIHAEDFVHGMSFKGQHHSEEAKSKIGAANSVHQAGKGNSQYATKWIHNLTLKKSKKIQKTDEVPEGWLLGRKLKF